MDYNEFQINKKLVYSDLLMLRFQKIFKEKRMSLSSDKFAEKLSGDWYVACHSLQGVKERIGYKGRKFQSGIYKSKNFLRSFLKCESCALPSRESLERLAHELGFRKESYFLLKDAHGFKDEGFKRMVDLLPHIKSGFTEESFLEACGYLVYDEKNRTYAPTSRFYGSPRVQLRQKILTKEAKDLAKRRKEAARIERDSKVDTSKQRLAGLKRFFNISKWKDDKIKEGVLNI